LFGSIVVNEVLTDGTTNADPNGDSDHDSVDDQFVEFLNVGANAIAIGNFTLVERDRPTVPRHTFRPGFVLGAGNAVVVYGGGDAPEATPTTTFFSANAADTGLALGLDLSPAQDSLLLLDGTGAVVARFCYGGQDDCAIGPASDQSLTRAPDGTGSFVPHRSASGSNGAIWSSGLRVDGGPF
jgi:hypothetical protein